ncbi:helix-turn-helix domain-containing protein [Paracoccus sp. (in: a-proteobacteria)]|uniref:helix-turn-helix domain-containing protein n=1 Tax=Paracoccus sp. TaxID=267 RepID=UPI0026DEF447|nr:helix-turn-helix domain-containing protein [Paracoccus sp. (in: a-proteobacteria)]MDO5648922.1 helix-turn-helix domain-containing protein [Paracoccus sp. (in: a-proteobacteria)]
MTPIDDKRPFAQVLADWKQRRGLTYEGLAEATGRSRATLARALAGDDIAYERDLRALMTLIDEGRA